MKTSTRNQDRWVMFALVTATILGIAVIALFVATVMWSLGL